MSSKSGTRSDRRIPDKVVCFKCKKLVDIRKTALCSTCNNRYELDCDGYPEGTYRLMDQESKKKWRCKTCKKNSNLVSNTSNSSNITMRRKANSHFSCSPPGQSGNVIESKPREAVKDSFQSTSDSTSDIADSNILSEYETSDESFNSPNKLSKSVDGTISDTLTVLEMKDTIKEISNKLLSTENELENTILENNSLRQQLDKLTAEINILKSLCHSSHAIGNSPVTNHKKKRHSLLHQSAFSTPSTPLTKSSSNANIDYEKSIEILCLQQKITDLQKQLEDAQQQILACKKMIDILKHDNTMSKKQTPVSKIITQAPTFIEEHIQQPSNKVLIFGSQQCVGLAAAMIQSRQNTRYEKYRIMAVTKPNALCSEIIKSCRHAKLNCNDKLVICVGEHDFNLKYILSQLQIVLETFYNNMIIVLNVFNNEYLDVKKLNYRIQNVCNQYKKCKFLESETFTISELCTKINYYIDCNDYNENYVNPRELMKRLAGYRSSLKLIDKYNANTDKSNALKKGTIPFYFNKQNTLQLHNTDNTVIGPQTNPSDKPQKGTIPYYFSKMANKNTFFRTSKCASFNA